MAIIGFDARSVRTISTGLGKTARCLLKKISELDTNNQYVVFQRKELPEPLIKLDRFRTVLVGYDIASLRNQFLFSRVLSEYNVDLYHSPNAFLPFALPTGLKTIITIHDFNWVQRPALAAATTWQGHINGIYGRFAHRYAVSRANHIVCVSNRTRKDLHQLYPADPKTVTTIYHGYELDSMESETVATKVHELGTRRYILSVGNGRPYKNPEGTVKAFSKIKADSNNQDVLLVVVGRGDSTPYLRRLVRRHGIGDSVLFLGMVTDSELVFLFKNALFLSFPSRWEGFGLPVIEAFATGCPVLASTAGSLPEICDGAAYMINDPESITEIAHGFDSLIHTSSLRTQLRKRGLQRAQRFNWNIAAEQYLAVYNSTLIH